MRLKIEFAPCPICGGAPRMGRVAKRGTTKNPFMIFCDGSDHYVEVFGVPRRAIVTKWNELPRKQSHA